MIETLHVFFWQIDQLLLDTLYSDVIDRQYPSAGALIDSRLYFGTSNTLTLERAAEIVEIEVEQAEDDNGSTMTEANRIRLAPSETNFGSLAVDTDEEIAYITTLTVPPLLIVANSGADSVLLSCLFLHSQSHGYVSQT